MQFFLSFMLCNLVYIGRGMEFFLFHREYVDRSMTSPHLWNLNNVVDKISCVVSCAEDPECRTLQFSDIHRTCHGYPEPVSFYQKIANSYGKKSGYLIFSIKKVSLKPNSCAEIQACGEKVDQEYWIYPKRLGGKRLKVYCNGMADNDTAEYITLPQKNHGEYPNLQNIYCRGADVYGLVSLAGSYWYKKIRIHPESMVVNRSDKTFTEGKGVIYNYGEASDCYTPLWNENTCGPKGFFNIDTSGTGLIVNPSLVWKPYGFRPYKSVVREKSNAVVKLRCGGACGGCRPDGDLKLILNPKEVLATTSAKEVTCSSG